MTVVGNWRSALVSRLLALGCPVGFAFASPPCRSADRLAACVLLGRRPAFPVSAAAVCVTVLLALARAFPALAQERPSEPPGEPLAVPGLVSREVAPPRPADDWTAAYELGPRDRVSVAVFGQAPLSGQYVVDGEGAIMFPLLGTVPAAGLTPSELAGALTRRLAAGYLREPRVTVALDAARSRRVFVVGAVRSPGAYTLDGPVRLLEVLALAGSATRDAYGEVVLSRRDRAGVPMVSGLDALGGGLEGGVPPGRVLNLEALQAGRAGDDIVLRDGDLVYVRPAGRVFVRGQVTDPGEYPLRVGMTVRQLVASAGGFTPFAARGRIHLERSFAEPGAERPATRRIRVGLDFVLHQDDTVHVGTRWF